MKTLYLKVEICKALQDEREEIDYYILKDETYGLSISKTMNNKELKEEIKMENLFSSEKEVKDVIDMIINQGNDFSQIGYIVEDIKKKDISSIVS